MENGKKEQIDLEKELMPIRVKNIKLNYQRYKDIQESLKKAKIDRKKKEGKIIGGSLAAIIAVAGIGIATAKTHKDPTANTNAEVSIMMEDSKFVIDRYYTVVDGDSLSLISDNTGVPINDIRQENSMEATDTLIFPNQKLRLSYEINSEDLQYCTDQVKVNGKTLEEIASEYGTTAETLLRLNENSVVRTHNEDYSIINYEINSDTIMVPNFVSIKDGVKGNQK